ncbi:MAG TPA: prolyl oligopeptidase family serine peptidase [Herpetosiphonaceae bacterium]
MASPTAPAARIEVVRDTYFGTTIEDPYRWMEDWTSDEARAWLAAQMAYTQQMLDALPERDALLARISELGGTTPELTELRMAGGRYFYLRREPGADVARLVVRLSPDASERILVDPSTIASQGHMAIDWFAPARDGRLVACGISEGGSEDSTLCVLDVDTGEQLPDTISRVRFQYVSWLEDNRSFVYHRYPDPPADTPAAERRYHTRSYLHHLGDDPEQDLVVFARGLNQRVPMNPIDRPFVIVPGNSDWMIGVISHSALGRDEWSDCTFYVAPRAALVEPATCPWTRLATVEDGVRNFAIDGDTLYLVTRRTSPRYEVLALTLPNTDLSQARVMVPESQAVIESVCVTDDYLLIRELDAGIGRLRRVALAGGELESVALPVNGTIVEWACDSESPDVVLYMTSWTVSPRAFRYDTRSGAVEDTGWVPPAPIDFGDIEAYEVEAPAQDGTLIPLSIIHRRGLPRDGERPTLLTVYGSYGFSLLAYFRPEMLAWYERGGVWAIAHVRGGGEHGREWHEAGRKLNKENTITDFIACAEYLIAQGYTRPERLAGEGGSAGGIPTGGALVRRPDLWAVMVMHVAVTNSLRIELGENGPINVPEFGSVTTEEGFQSLHITDSYARVQDGVAYPAVLLTAGLNDPRVDLWQATKMTARLQAATASGKPVLLRAQEDAGHGMGTTKHQLDAELADELAFLWQQFGA